MNQSVIASPSCTWREERGVIRLSVAVDGTAGPLWIPRLRLQGCEVSRKAERVLRSPNFTLSNHGTLEIAILRGSLFRDGKRDSSTIRAAANDLMFMKPETDMGCIFRETFTDEVIAKMGFGWVNIMHESIVINSGGFPQILCVDQRDGGRLLRTTDDLSGIWWSRENGFAFAVAPQVNSQCSVP